MRTLFQLNMGEISPAVLGIQCLPQILTILFPYATVSQDGVGASLLSPLPTSALCFGLPRDQLAY